jgi:hypothetical protein
VAATSAGEEDGRLRLRLRARGRRRETAALEDNFFFTRKLVRLIF